MKCRECRKVIGRAADRELAPAEWAALEEHVAACAGCRVLHEGNLRLSQVLAAVPEPELPPQLAAEMAALAARTLAAEAGRPAVRWSVPAAAAAGLLLGLVLGSQAFPRVVERPLVVQRPLPAVGWQTGPASEMPARAGQSPREARPELPARPQPPTGRPEVANTSPAGEARPHASGPPDLASPHRLASAALPAETARSGGRTSTATPAPAEPPTPTFGLALMRVGAVEDAVPLAVPEPSAPWARARGDSREVAGAVPAVAGRVTAGAALAARDESPGYGAPGGSAAGKSGGGAVATVPVEPDWDILADATEELTAAAQPIPVFIADRSGGLLAYRPPDERPLLRMATRPVLIFAAEGGDGP